MPSKNVKVQIKLEEYQDECYVSNKNELSNGKYKNWQKHSTNCPC